MLYGHSAPHDEALHPTRLTLPQLESSYRLYLDRYSHQLQRSSSWQYNQTLGVDDACRGYLFTRNDKSKIIVYQPVVVETAEEMGHPSIKDAIEQFNKLPKQTKKGINTVVMPIAQLTDVGFGYVPGAISKHFITLALAIDPNTGQILSGQTIDSKGYYGTLLTRENDIERTLKECSHNQNFLYQGRRYLGFQPFYDNINCGIHSHLICRDYLHSPNPTLEYQSVGIAGNYPDILRQEVKTETIMSVQQGVMSAALSLPQDVESPVASRRQSTTFTTKRTIPTVDIGEETSDIKFDDDIIESFRFVQGDNLSASVLVNANQFVHKKNSSEEVDSDFDITETESPTKSEVDDFEIVAEPSPPPPLPQVEISDACFAQTHKPYCRERAAWMVAVGENILDKLYNTDLTVGNANYIGTLMDSILQEQNLLQDSGLDKPENKQQLEHNKGAYTKGIFSLFSIPKNINRYFRGNEDYAIQRRNYVIAINCVMWALYNQAALNGKDFSKGSFKLIDPDNRLFQFLKGYVQFANRQENQSYMSSNNFAYPSNRKSIQSNHQPDPSFQTEQYGIDLRLMGTDDLLDMLPNGQAHLLCGDVNINDNHLTFIKFEPVGLGSFLEFIEHEYQPSESNDENEIPIKLNEIYQEFLATYANLYSEVLPSAKSASEMYQQISEASKDPEYVEFTVFQRRFNMAIEQLDNVADYIKIRTGKEIILDPSHSYDTHQDLFQSTINNSKTHPKVITNEALHPLKSSLAQYANEVCPDLSAVFQSRIDALKSSGKDYPQSICDDLTHLTAAQLFSTAFPYPIQTGNRDQLAIDLIHQYRDDPRVIKIINSYAAINTMQGMGDRVHEFYKALLTGEDTVDAETFNQLVHSYQQYGEEAYQRLTELESPDIHRAAETFQDEISNRFKSKSQSVQQPKFIR